jgi:hypothetical protein
MSTADTATSLLKTVLPWIGTALGGPLGAGAATFVASKLGIPADTVTDTLTAMVGNPEQLAKVKQIEADYKTHCLEIGYQSIKDIETINASVTIETVKAVNTTMQAETTAEHWPTWSWRPFCGFIFGVTFFGNYFILPLCKIQSAAIPSEAWVMLGSILGVASFFRGKMQADPQIPAATRLIKIPAGSENTGSNSVTIPTVSSVKQIPANQIGE